MGTTMHIHRKFRMKGGEIIPFTGWLVSNRHHIYELFAELGYKVGAEIGVRAGNNARVMFQKNPKMKLYCVDTWAPFEGGVPSQHKQNMYFYNAKKVLRGYDVVFLKKTSMEALSDIQDGSLDFVYIDAMHDFDNVMIDIIGWSKKVKSGGIVSGHDYANDCGIGVIPAVNGYVAGHTITEWYITKEKNDNRSFFWVKP